MGFRSSGWAWNSVSSFMCGYDVFLGRAQRAPQSLIAIDLGFAFKVKFFLVNFLFSWSSSPPNAEVWGQSSPHLFAVWLGIQNKHLPLKACLRLALKSLHYPSLNISKYSLYLGILYGGENHYVRSFFPQVPIALEGEEACCVFAWFRPPDWMNPCLWQQLALIVRHCLSTLLVLSHLRVNHLTVLWDKH